MVHPNKYSKEIKKKATKFIPLNIGKSGRLLLAASFIRLGPMPKEVEEELILHVKNVNLHKV